MISRLHSSPALILLFLGACTGHGPQVMETSQPASTQALENTVGSYTGEVIDATNCKTACDGCTWSTQVSSEMVGTSCNFTWTANRTDCAFSVNAEFTGTTTVPCNETQREVFYCDSAGDCPGYQLTFSSGTCPTQPGGP